MKRSKIAVLTAAACVVLLSLSACQKQPVTSQETKESTEYRAQFPGKSADSLKAVEGNGEIKTADQGLSILSRENDRTIILDTDMPDMQNSEAELVFDPVNDNEGGLYGIIVRYAPDGSWTFIGQDGVSAKDPDLTSWVMYTSDGKRELLCTDGQRVYARREKPYTLKVKAQENTVTIYLDQALIFSGEVNGMTQGFGKTGILCSNGSGMSVSEFSIAQTSSLTASQNSGAQKEIQSSDMTVILDESFPRVVGYRLTSGEEMKGQMVPCYEVEINNQAYTPKVSAAFQAEKAVYHLSVPEVSVEFDVNFIAKKQVLRMEIANIKDSDNLVKTINFPGHSLISLPSDAPGGQLRVNNYRKEEVIDLKKTTTMRAFQTTSLAVLSSDQAAASINSGNINNRQEIAYQTIQAEGKYTTGLWVNEYQYRGLDKEPLDTLWTEVVVTGDRNGDEKVDFQDGAIARRDEIGTQRLGSSEVKNSYSMIAMDVGSIAQYPFLRILDNIKKFNAGTDGFEQMVLIKGYQSEGHDASHPDYANISQRAGGKEDFSILLNEAGKYGAKIGLHINHTEAYPEAAQYSDTLVADTPGWTWYDDSYHIIRENDILDKENGMEKRLDDLAALTEGKLSMIYVDTYQDSRWQSEKLSQKIKDLGWMLGTEYSEEMIKESTWSHTLNAKNINYDTTGNLVRFVDNQTKDIFPNSPLFRGLVNRNTDAGFNGWQECKSYDATIENFYTKVLPQRYLANFPVNRWESATKVSLGENNQVVTEMADGVNRISKDGNPVAIGDCIFIPWDPVKETKIYHWNSEGGTTTWTLPKTWKTEQEVKVFLLTDQGRTEQKVVAVTDQTITLEAAAKKGYVIYKGTDPAGESDLTQYDWSEGSPVKDMGFDSHTFGYAWEAFSSSGNTNHITFEDNALETAAEKDKADNNKGNTHIHIQGEEDAVLTQTMTGLKSGQAYSASVFLQGNEGRKLSISVTTPDGNTVENYADRFDVAYGCPHNDRFGTSYQRVKLEFVQPEGSDTAVIQLKADKNIPDGWANFDNVRVTPIQHTDKNGHEYFEDFENVDQEFGPFVCPTKVTQSHLSEKNGEWTNDVIGGRYSLKIRGNGNTEQKFNYMRTVPHRVRLLPNTTYTVGLDYMVPDVKANLPVFDGANAFVLGVKSDQALQAGDDANAVLVQVSCQAGDSKAKQMEEITFTTGEYDDYYIDLYDETYSYEFIIDNFYVDKK